MDSINPTQDVIGTAPVSITVLSVTPMRAGKLFAMAAVEVDVDGVAIEHRIADGAAHFFREDDRGSRSRRRPGKLEALCWNAAIDGGSPVFNASAAAI